MSEFDPVPQWLDESITAGEAEMVKMGLTNAMHDAVKNSPVGQFIDRLIREEVSRGGNTSFGDGTHGNVIQALWSAFMSGARGKSFREIRQEIEHIKGTLKLAKNIQQGIKNDVQ